MHASVVKAYKVTGDIDTMEGRGGSKLIGYYLKKEDAFRAARGKGVQGDGVVEDIHAIAFENGEAFAIVEQIDENYKHRKLREAALAKLTHEERDALGLSMVEQKYVGSSYNPGEGIPGVYAGGIYYSPGTK